MERRVEKLERRADGLSAAILQLITAAQGQSEMLDDYFRGLRELREAQANTDIKIAALVDAQIRAEDLSQTMRQTIVEAQARVEAEMRALRQAITDIADLTRARADQQEARMEQQEARMEQHEAQLAQLRQQTANLALIAQTIINDRASE